MTPIGVKTCGESEFDIFEAKKRFSDSGKAYCVLMRKVAKMRFLPKNDPFGDKNVQNSSYSNWQNPKFSRKKISLEIFVSRIKTFVTQIFATKFSRLYPFLLTGKFPLFYRIKPILQSYVKIFGPDWESLRSRINYCPVPKVYIVKSMRFGVQGWGFRGCRLRAVGWSGKFYTGKSWVAKN